MEREKFVLRRRNEFTNPVSMPLDEVCVLEGSLEGLCLFVIHLRVKSQFPVKLNLRLGI